MKLLRKINIRDLEFEIYRTEPEDWERISEEIMKIEYSAFEEGARQSRDDIESTFIDERSVNLVIVDNKQRIIGYTMGSPLEDYWFSIRYLELCPELKGKTYYIESTALSPDHQGRGLAYILRETLIIELKKEGYEFVSSHATHPAILRIYEKLEKNGFLKDCKIVEKIENWIGNRTGYFVICKIN
ncbi:MAG: GNAT family N-acetyltransferase [Candidatus Aenigmatarchaeota archaeon]